MIFDLARGHRQHPFFLKVQQKLRKVLVRYWRFSRNIAGILFTAIISPVLVNWFQESWRVGHLTVPDITSYVTTFFHIIPWPMTLVGLTGIGGITCVAWFTQKNNFYYELLDTSKERYHQIRKAGGNMGAQLKAQIEHDSMIKLFDTKIYTERTRAVTVFDTFLQQQQKRIFLVIGRGGTGKSTFLQHRMGELCGVLPATSSRKSHRRPCVYIDCKTEFVTDEKPLAALIEKHLGHTLEELAHQLHRDHPLIIFLDALNENTAPIDIGIHLTHFSNKYLNKNYPLALCLSIRKTYWDEQSHISSAASEASGWLDAVYRPDMGMIEQSDMLATPGLVSIQLDNFDKQEYEQAFQHYSAFYHVQGTIQDERMLKICRNPLMLRMLCAALQGQDITHRILLRELDIFEEYAKTALSGTIRRIGTNISTRILEQTIRSAVLELALGMIKYKRPFLSNKEVFALLQKNARSVLEIGKEIVRNEDYLYVPGTVLHAILEEGEGIVLERGEYEIAKQGRCHGIRFVHERYFEYSIGRALVYQWNEKCLTAHDLRQDFERWMHKHYELMKDGFTNLRQGLGMAILLTELYAELYPSIYADLPPDIQYTMLERLAQDKDFTWNQLACLRIPQLRIWNASHTLTQEAFHTYMERLLQCIDHMSSKNDFVLRWDIERALFEIVNQGSQTQQNQAQSTIARYPTAWEAVLQHLQTWHGPTVPFAQQLFGAEFLGLLFKQIQDKRYRLTVIHALKQIATTPRLDFWIRRSLLFSINTILEAINKDAASEELLFTEMKEEMLALASALLDTCQNQWERSTSISFLIAYAATHNQPVNRYPWKWGEEEIWTCTNAVLALEQTCSHGHCTEDIVELLHTLWKTHKQNPHLTWALAHTLQQAITNTQTSYEVRTQAIELREAIIDYAQVRLVDDEREEWTLPEMHTQTRLVSSSIAIIYHPEYAHEDLHNHPESKERVESIINALDSLPIPQGSQRQELLCYVSPYDFLANQQWETEVAALLRTVHQEEWIHRVRELSDQLKGTNRPDIVLESDIEVRAGSYEGAYLAVHGAVGAADLVISNPHVKLALALLRPPGHLAGNKICIFNNIAIAARYAQQQGKRRVLIVDCDAHHGLHTHTTFYGDTSVVYFSTHQAGVHPGTGSFTERGKDQAFGYTVNVPLPVGSGDRVYEEVLEHILQPLLTNFTPEIILVSLGLDAYYKDFFSQLEFSEFSYFLLAKYLSHYCQQHNGVGVVAALEGGYALEGMGPCVIEFMRAFSTCPWFSQKTSLQARISSRLDQYLSANSPEQRGKISLTNDDKQWLKDLSGLKTVVENLVKQTTPVNTLLDTL